MLFCAWHLNAAASGEVVTGLQLQHSATHTMLYSGDFVQQCVAHISRTPQPGQGLAGMKDVCP